MTRHTVALTSRSTGLAVVDEAQDVNAAIALMNRSAYDGALLALDAGTQAMELIERLRTGKTKSSRQIQIAVMVNQCDAATEKKLQAAGIKHIVVRPFKVKTLLNTICMITVGG
jgi:DNA-binding NarL/FixJ family response regulator